MAQNKDDTSFLMEDIFDFLMENKFAIGTNIRDEFPNSTIEGHTILLKDKKNVVKFFLTIKKGAQNEKTYE